MMGIFDEMLGVCSEVKNSRNLWSVLTHMEGETTELEEEIDRYHSGLDQGEDGIVGESVDVILCAIDIIYMANPEITENEIIEVMRKKAAKWKRVYSNA